MNSPIKNLYDFLNQCLNFQERLGSYHLDPKSVEQLFAWLDKRRRGFIDVSDFYEKFPDLQEDELFFVFKTLDYSRTGNLTLMDLKETVMIKGYSSGMENNCDFQRTFRAYVRLLKASFHSLEGEKARLGVRPQAIQTCFEIVSAGRRQISIDDLVRTFDQQRLAIGSKMINYLSQHIFGNERLSGKQFVNVFIPSAAETTRTYQREQPGVLTLHQEEEEDAKFEYQEQRPGFSQIKLYQKAGQKSDIDLRIDEILRKYQNVPKKSNDLSKVQSHQNLHSRNSPPSSIMGERLRSPQLVPQKTHGSVASEFYRSGVDQIKYKESKPQNQVHEVRGDLDFNRRREELRRGSLERQRIIQDVLGRRKKTAQWDSSNPQFYRPTSAVQPEYEKYEQHIVHRQPATEMNFNRRPQSASKGSSKTQACFAPSMNRFENGSKPDLKLFYRNTGETPSKNYALEKENILRRAEQEASKKIEQIERKARLKVMEKRSANGVYSRWLK